MIPQTFTEWKACIVHDCKITITKEFTARRLAIYQDKSHKETRQFAALYGKQHLQNVINWLKQAQGELQGM